MEDIPKGNFIWKNYDQAQSTCLFDLDVSKGSGNGVYTADAYTFDNDRFFETKDISEGDELSFDYQSLTSEDDGKETNVIDFSNGNYVCKCLSPKCTRNIHL
ncbi:hypothetical protein K502DRAFT_349547 [Neoconidiobolus thromboides FSU 785]|nr:hypothetical protein K502DRAFT_349547 [Neoconidiobolus thromboides FSU 785]